MCLLTLVHMIKASESDFVRVKNEGISVVVCPRSNAFFGLKPDYDLMKNVLGMSNQEMHGYHHKILSRNKQYPNPAICQVISPL